MVATRGVTAHILSSLEDGVTSLREASSRDAVDSHIPEKLFLAVGLMGAQRSDEAAESFRGFLR